MSTPSGPVRIVVADSDRTILELLQIRLDVAGYQVCVARTGVVALETVRYMRPAALVIDLNLPEMNAIDVLRALGPRGSSLPCPTLLIGRNMAIEQIKLALSLGVKDCMTKPFSGADALERISRLLRPPAPAKARPVHYLDEKQVRRA